MRLTAKIVNLLLVFAVAAGGGCGGREALPDTDQAEAPRRHVASASCPLKTPADWQRFLTLATEGDGWVTTCSDLSDCESRSGEFASHVQRDVLDMFASCRDDIVQNPPIAACTERLRRYAPAWMRQHVTGTYGFDQDNATYFAAQEAASAPAGMMVPPAAVIAALPLRADVEAVARKNGWPYLVHDSCLGGIRLFLRVTDPEERFDQWMLFGLDAGATVVDSPAIMSFIAVQRRDANGTLPRVRLHFRDYLVTSTANGWVVDLPRGYEGKCYACHTSGLRQLLPRAGTVTQSSPVLGEPGYGSPPSPASGVQRLQSFNATIAAYGLPDWAGTLDPADHGPPLGHALGCTTCHDGVRRGPVTVSTSEGMLRQKVLDQLSMRAFTGTEVIPDQAAMDLLARESSGSPPLSVEEHADLAKAKAIHLADYDALVASRYPTWRAWALASRCD